MHLWLTDIMKNKGEINWNKFTSMFVVNFKNILQ